MRSDPVTTDGWRGLPGPDWSEATVARILAGLAEEGVLGVRTAVAFDSRAGSSDLAVLGCDLLRGLGINCCLADGPSPTPALGRFVRDNADVTSGITFTASHNPPGYVGMKLRDREGLSLDLVHSQPRAASIPYESAVPVLVSLNAHYATTVGRDLQAALCDFDGYVVIDAAHGALGGVAPMLTQVNWHRSRPLPFFCGVTPDPVVPENVNAAWQAMLHDMRHPERLLAAFCDGDGDRLVLATAGSGYISSAEQAAIVCLARAPVAVVIATVVTPRMMRQVACDAGLDWLEVPVGFKHVVAAWRAQGRPAALGLEPNGALAYNADPRDYFERDALRALALVIKFHPSVAAIDYAIAVLRDQYPDKPEMMTSPMAVDDVLRRLVGILSGWRAEHGDLVWSFTREAWRILVRPSGTEKATRIYLEAPPDVISSIRDSLCL